MAMTLGAQLYTLRDFTQNTGTDRNDTPAYSGYGF